MRKLIPTDNDLIRAISDTSMSVMSRHKDLEQLIFIQQAKRPSELKTNLYLLQVKKMLTDMLIECNRLLKEQI